MKVNLRKMETTLGDVVEYRLRDENDEVVFLNEWIGSEVTIKFMDKIYCTACNKLIAKSYQGGYCFQCLQSLPETDMCQVKPELCHYDRGTCRDSAWGEKYCFKPHKVYLARSSGIKVGITREDPTVRRWMDQGAIEGMVIAEVPDRKTSGLIESALAQHISDKTDFRKMLRGEISTDDLETVYEEIVDHVPLQYQIHLVDDLQPVRIAYPLREHPQKIKTRSLDKEHEVSGTLKGIKGQYLVFEEFVFNVRAHSGYDVELEGTPTENPPEPSGQEPDQMNLFDLMS